MGVPKPTSRQFDSGWITSGLPLGGNVQIVANNNGDTDFRGYARGSGFDNIDYTISALIMTPDLLAIPFQHSGHVEGTIAGLPFGTPNRDNPFDSGVVNIPEVAAHWDGILQGELRVRLDGTDTLVQDIGGLFGDALKAYAAELGKNAADFKVTSVHS